MLQTCFILALSSAQKQQIIDLLASGKTASQAAETVGCSRATVQRVKQDPKFESLMQIATGLVKTNQLNEQGNQILEALQTYQDREPQMQEAMWVMFQGMSGLFAQTLAQTDPADISPRQLPSLAKSVLDIANAYGFFTDRIHGMDAIVSEVKKIRDSRTPQGF